MTRLESITKHGAIVYGVSPSDRRTGGSALEWCDPMQILLSLTLHHRERYRRLQRRLTGRISAEDCHLAVREGLTTMRRNQSANRDRAVTAITRANQLSALRADALTAIRQIERQLKKNGVNSAQLTAEIATQKEIAESLIPRIKQAESEVADVKRRIREEELRFRKATARALAAEFLINAEVCTENLKHVLAEAEREYPELRRPETAT